MTNCEEKERCEIANETIKTYTFDIFDTLFTRRTAVPIGIFKYMQYKLSKDVSCPSFIGDNFILMRTETELYLRKNKYELEGAEDVTLDEIYDTLDFNFNLGEKLKNKIKNLEIELEINNVVPMKKNIELFKSLKNKENCRVMLVSDMYLPETVIRRMLAKADSCFDDVKLYLSCECGHKTKHYGSLYTLVKEKENLELNKWEHFGDNPHADVFRAKEKGIHTNMTSALQLSPFGNYLIQWAPNDAIIDAIAGASRISQKENMSRAYRFGANVTAPLLYSYINWAIKDAIVKNYKDLYFVARDGYILKIIADEIIKKRNLNIKTHYIYGSRYAWRLINDNNYEDVIDYTFDEYEDIDISLIAKRLGINDGDLKKYFNISSNDFSDKEKYKQILKENSEFKNYVLKIHENKKELVTKYILQECGLNQKDIVFVDLDGSGRTQDCLQEAISDKINSCIHCYYFFQYFSTTQKEKSKKYSYILTLSRFNNWIEALTRNLEGQVLGYEYNNEKIVPVLDKFPKEQMINWGYNDYIEGIIAYTNNIIDFENINNIDVDSYLFFLLLDDYKNCTKDTNFVELLGSIVYEDIGDESGGFAGPLSFKECMQMLCGEKGVLPPKMANVRLRQSKKIYCGIFQLYKNYGSLRKFLINVTIRTRSNMFEITFLGLKFKSKKIAKFFKKLRG